MHHDDLSPISAVRDPVERWPEQGSTIVLVLGLPLSSLSGTSKERFLKVMLVNPHANGSLGSSMVAKSLAFIASLCTDASQATASMPVRSMQPIPVPLDLILKVQGSLQKKLVRKAQPSNHAHTSSSVMFPSPSRSIAAALALSLESCSTRIQ